MHHHHHHQFASNKTKNLITHSLKLTKKFQGHIRKWNSLQRSFHDAASCDNFSLCQVECSVSKPSH